MSPHDYTLVDILADPVRDHEHEDSPDQLRREGRVGSVEQAHKPRAAVERARFLARVAPKQAQSYLRHRAIHQTRCSA